MALMASKSCVSCLRAFQRQSRLIFQNKKAPLPAARAFTLTTPRSAGLPQPNQGPASSIPLATPKVTERDLPKDDVSKKIFDPAKSENRKVGGLTETYTAYGATETLYKECSVQADYSIPQQADHDAEVPKTDDGEDLGVGGGWWHNELGLKPTFSTWSQVTMLHIYILSARFRCFEPEVCRIWQQHLLDHFFYDMESKMVINHGMHARGTRNRYLKDIFIQWRGVLAAYDEGLAKNDAVLGGAIWRNVFKASEDVDIAKLAQIVSFMRRTLSRLESVDDLKIMQGRLAFGGPAGEEPIVAKRSGMLGQALDAPQVPKAGNTPPAKN